MFLDISIESDNRIVEIREYIDFVSTQIPSPPIAIPRYLNTAKGLVYIQLYGVVEYVTLAVVSKSINYINNLDLKVSDLKPVILSLALAPQLDALIEIKSKKWDKRHEMFLKLESNDKVEINTDIFPTDGKNITHAQIASIWKTFSIDMPMFHDITFRGRLQDIVSNRINIAHGNNSASEVGSHITIEDLRRRLNDVSGFCTYFINVFDDYIKSRKFIKKQTV